MSTKRKKPLASTPTRKSYDLDKVLGKSGEFLGGGDELDDVLRQQRKMQADKFKQKQIELMNLELERDMNKLKKEVGSTGGFGGQMPTPAELAYIAQLPEEQRGLAIQAMAAFKGQGSGGGGDMGALLAVSLMQQKPQQNLQELVSSMKEMQAMIEGKKPETLRDVNVVLELARVVGNAKDEAYKSQFDYLRRELEERSPYDPVAQTKNIIDVANAIGMKPAGDAGNPEIERMRIESQNRWKQEDRQFELKIREMERADKRIESLLTALSPVLQSLGNAGATRIANPQGAGQSIPLVCPNCGFSPIWISAQNPVANCPQCHTPVTSQQFAQQIQQGPTQPPSGGSPPPPSGTPPPPGD